MMVFFTVLIVSISFTVFFILLTLKYRDYIDRVYLKREKEAKEKSLDELLDKYVIEEEKDIMKQKLSKISEIIKSTQKEVEEAVQQKVEVAETQLKAEGKELETLTKAQDEYISHTVGFRPAMPETEDERLQDLSDLKETISMLESFDEESYQVGPKKADAGLGMFYDKRSRRFMSIIDEHKLNESAFIPVQKLKYHAFQNIRSIKNSDILPILKVMQDTNLLKDIIEVNSTLQLIKFTEENLKFSNPEKVLMTFAYDEEYLTLQKLIEITEWKESYAERIIKGLVNKDVATYYDENINIKGFGHVEERNKWREIIEDQIQKEKKKAEEKRKREKERKKQLRKKLAKVEKAKVKEIKEEKVEKEKSPDEVLDSLDEISPTDEEPEPIEFGQKPSVATLPKAKKKPAKEEKPIKKKEKPKEKKVKKKKETEKQLVKDKDDLLGAMDALDEIMPVDGEKKPSKKEKAKGEEEKELEFEEGGEEAQDIEDLVPEKILNYHENFSLINGGLVQFEKLEEYVKQEIEEEIPEDLFEAMLTQLKELGMIQNITKIGKHQVILFNELSLGIDGKNFLRVAMNEPPLKKEDFEDKLHWPEEKVLKVMKSLQEKGVIKIEKDKVVIPGIEQKE